MYYFALLVVVLLLLFYILDTSYYVHSVAVITVTVSNVMS